MALYQIPVLKAKRAMAVDSDKVDQELYKYALQLGFKAILNRMSKIKKEDYASDSDFVAAATAKAEELVECLYSGKGIRMVGFKAKGPAGKEKVEARRIAREYVRQSIKDGGEKVTDYSLADITAAADAMIEANPEIMEEAVANLKSREEKSKKFKVDIKSMSKTPKAQKGAALKDRVLSAAQAGRTATREAPARH